MKNLGEWTMRRAGNQTLRILATLILVISALPDRALATTHNISDENEITLAMVGLMLIGTGLITFIYYFPRKGDKKLHRQYIESKSQNIEPTFEMKGAFVYVNTRKLCLLLIAVGLLLLVIHYIF